MLQQDKIVSGWYVQELISVTQRFSGNKFCKSVGSGQLLSNGQIN